MQKFIGKLLITSVGVIIADYLIDGVHIKQGITAIVVALVLGLLNSFVRPLLILLTIPITILTLGLFLLVINIAIVKWVAVLVDGFSVDGWWSALLFSLIVSFFSSLVQGIIKEKTEQ